MDNKTYINFTLEDVQESLNCSHTTGVKILAELDAISGIGLIERVKQGQGKPARIYVKNYNLQLNNDGHSHESSNIKKMELNKPRSRKPTLQESGSTDIKEEEVKTSTIKKSRHPEKRSSNIKRIRKEIRIFTLIRFYYRKHGGEENAK